MSYEYSDSYDWEELIDTLNNQVNKISDLKAKLEESEEQLKEELEEKNGVRRALRACHHQNDEFADMIKKLVSEKEELQKQLALQENTITNLVEDNRASQEWYKKQLTEKDEQIKELTECNQYLQIYRNQDKISFAVEQLEKVKEIALKDFNLEKGNLPLARVLDNIDNQIKAIKGEK